MDSWSGYWVSHKYEHCNSEILAPPLMRDGQCTFDKFDDIPVNYSIQRPPPARYTGRKS